MAWRTWNHVTKQITRDNISRRNNADVTVILTLGKDATTISKPMQRALRMVGGQKGRKTSGFTL